MERRGAVWAMILLSVSACSKASAPAAEASSHETAGDNAAVAKPMAMSAASATPGGAMVNVERVDRRVIRTADIGIDTDDVIDAERRASAIAEEQGGYVASSDRSSRASDGEPGIIVNMVLRIPSDHFMASIDRLEKLASRVLEQRVSSDDVTEEFIDVKARVVAQRTLEAQFLEILKQARSVKDALEVNTQLAEVRTTIERLQGRQRYLENQTSISTIELAITHGVPLVSAGRFAFAESIERAGADLLNVSAAIVHGGIRVLGVLAPILALVVLPGLAAVRALMRRRRRADA